MGQELPRGDVRIRPDHHERRAHRRSVHPIRVWDPDHAGVGDGRVGQEDPLDIARVHDVTA
jgi:hypothetical protein